MSSSSVVYELLSRWLINAEAHWYDTGTVDRAGHALGCYGSGYNSWGVQTNQKYLAAAAAVGTLGQADGLIDRQWAIDRALGALRFSLASHRSGEAACTDNTQWGNTWISGLGIERMMFAVALLDPHMDDADHQALERVLSHECQWLLHHYGRGRFKGIQANVWGSSGQNDPESNIWNGALLWRTAQMYPDHPQAEEWREKAVCFLINGVSVQADADDSRVVDGRPIRDRHVGANFFPNYALDHHGYLNVGYMTICVSNAAMLHFDLKKADLPAPQSLHHHQDDLWAVLRRLIYSDARLARIGGDTRVRYAYCQEYLLPSLLYAADRHRDGHALSLADRQVELIQREANHHADGSFYSGRLVEMQRVNPYYYTRLESDRACAMAMYLAYRPMVDQPETPAVDFETSVAGGWCEVNEYGAAAHRSPTRLAAFVWRANGLTQATCQPPDDGHLAEWQQNLVSEVLFADDRNAGRAAFEPHRRLLRHQTHAFEGGFLTYGAVMEGVDRIWAEGWRGTDLGEHQIVYAALPDEHTAVSLAFCRTAGIRTWPMSVKGINLQLPNDLYNNHRRELLTQAGPVTLTAPAAEDEVLPLPGSWVNVEHRLGLVALYGQDDLCVDRSSQRRGGKIPSLLVEQICLGSRQGALPAEPNSVILDLGFAAVSSATGQQTQQLADHSGTMPNWRLPTDWRHASVRGLDGCYYLLVANFSRQTGQADLPTRSWRLVTPSQLPSPSASSDQAIALQPGEAVLLVQA